MPVVTKDALAGKHGEYEIVLANPPFGKKSSVTIVNEAGESSKESLNQVMQNAQQWQIGYLLISLAVFIIGGCIWPNAKSKSIALPC